MSATKGRPRASVDLYGDARYLYQVIETISSGPDLDTMLRGVVRLATEATACRACFVYFLEGEELVLRAATHRYRHAEGKVRLATDTGLAGWVTRTRRSAHIRDNALEDPRFVYVAELEEERFQSMIAVPILSRTGATIGAITMHTRAPHEFERAEVDFMEHTAALVAGAIENARLYEEATGRVALLTGLSRLARRIAAAGSVEELLPLVVGGCRQLLGADRCELHLAGPGDRLVPRAMSPGRDGARATPSADVGLAGMDAAGPPPVEAARIAERLWGAPPRGVPYVAPLIAGSERLGLLCALAPRPVPDGASVLAAVASHTAVAVKRHVLIDSLLERNLVRDFFDALTHAGPGDEVGRLAGRLGCDLAAPHAVLHAIPWTSMPPLPPEWQHATGRLESLLRRRLPGSLFDRGDTSMRALLRLPARGAPPMPALAGTLRDEVAAAGDGALVAVGLSNPTGAAAAVARGFEEAATAAHVGALLRGRAGVATYEELGAYRYALGGGAAVRDRYQDSVEKLLAYEERRGTELVRTLDTYLELQGSIARASRALYMHQNTLRQRLARIEQLTGLTVEREDWVALAMAIKAVRLRRLQGLHASREPTPEPEPGT